MISILLLETNNMLRQTFAMHAKESGLADVVHTHSLNTAKELVQKNSYDGIIVGLSDGLKEIGLIQEVRLGNTVCTHTLPIIVVLPEYPSELESLLNPLEVMQKLPRPLRVKTMHEAVELLTSQMS